MTPESAPRALPSRRRWLLLPAALAILFVLTGCYTIGDESSWLRVQNMGATSASYSIQFANSAGQLAGERACPSSACTALAPGAGMTVAFENASEFPAGVLGSASVGSDQPFAALMVSDVGRGNGRYQAAGDTFATTPTGGALYLPFITKSSGADATWHSRFAVQNVDSGVAACVTILYVGGSNGGPIFWEPYNPFQPPAQRPPGCPNGGFRLPAGSSVFRDIQSMPVPSGFRGDVRVLLHANGQGTPASLQNVVASAGVWNERSLDFASYRAFTAGELGTTMLLPLIERNAAGFWSTRFQIQNPGPDATVTLRIDGRDLTRNPPAPFTVERTFNVRGNQLCIQDDPSRDCLASGVNLPSEFQGHATITSTQAIAVVVHRENWANDSYLSYRGVRLGQAATAAFLPLVAKNAPAAGRTGKSAFIRIQVADGSNANVTIRYRGSGGSTSEVSQTLTVPGAGTVTLDVDPSVPLPSGFLGSAIVESNKALVTVVALTTGDAPGDNRLMYNAVPP